MVLGAAGIKGAEQASYYTKISVAQGAEYYATAANLQTEWIGQGATSFGLAGPVGAAELSELMLGRNPRTGEKLGRAFVESNVRGNSSRAWDMTFSVPKEVSVLWAAAKLEGREQTAQEIESAIMASCKEVVAELEQTYASTRVGSFGQQVWTDVEGITTAAFLQADSRALDPQLHVHLLVSSKVQRPDGEWGTLHPTMMLKHRQSLGRLADSCLGAELRNRLGIAADSQSRIASVPERLTKALSTRRAQVLVGYQARLEQFVDRQGRQPTPLESWRLRQQASTDTRDRKFKGSAETAVLDKAAGVFAELDINPQELLDSSLGQLYETQRPDHQEIATKALEQVSALRSTWHRQDVAKEVAMAIPDTWAASAKQVRAFVTQATDEAMKSCVVLEPGVGATPYEKPSTIQTKAPHATICTTEAIIKEADHLADWGRRANHQAPSQQAEQRALDSGADPLQAQAAAAIAGRAPVALVVGPPGTGKTTAMGAAVAQLRADNRPIVLTTVSHQARQELSESSGEQAIVLEAMRYQIAEGLLELPSGTTIIVDEASMVNTSDMVWLSRLVQRAGHRVVLVGDPQQLGAVGRGGVFADLVAENQDAVVQLDKVWRFRSPGEAEAATALRTGDTQALGWYEERERLIAVPSPSQNNPSRDSAAHDSPQEAVSQEVVQLWQASAQLGAVGVFCDTNEQTTSINQAIQQRRIELGEVRPTQQAPKSMRDELIHVGDQVALRGTDEDGRIITDAAKRIYNRDRGTVVAITADNAAVVSFPKKGQVLLDASQVRNRIELGYALTCHGGQGMTIGSPDVAGTAIYCSSNAGDAASLLVGATRGRDRNFIVGAAQDTAELRANLEAQMGRNRVDLTPRAAMREQDRTPKAQKPARQAPKTTTMDALGQMWAERDSLAEIMQRAQREAISRNAALQPLEEQVKVKQDAATIARQEVTKAQRSVENLPRFGHRKDRQQTNQRLDSSRERLTEAEQELEQAEAVLQAAQQQLRPDGAWKDRHQDEADRLRDLDYKISHVASVSGKEASENPPAYLVAELGEPGEKDLQSWSRAAGEINSYRARWGIEDEAQALPEVQTPLAEFHLQRVRDKLNDLGFGLERGRGRTR